MAAGQDDQVALPDQQLGFCFVPPVQDGGMAEVDAGLRKSSRKIPGEAVGVGVVIRVGSDEQRPGPGRQSRLEMVDKAVGRAEDRPFRPNDAGAAGHKNGHSGRSFSYCATL